MTAFSDFVREQSVRATRAGIVLAEYARQGVPVLVTGRRYGRHASADALVSPDPSRPGAWRVTWCADGAPNDDGHLEAPTLYTGLLVAYRPGARLTQVTPETAPMPVQHPDGCGACDPEAPCAECASAYGLLDAADGEEKMREEQAA